MAIKTVYDDEELRVWRARERLSQAEAAELMETTQRTLGRWEAGRYPRDLMDRMERAKAILAARRGTGNVTRAIVKDRKATERQAIAWLKEKHCERMAAKERYNAARFGETGPSDADTIAASETLADYTARMKREVLERFGMDPTED